MKRKTVLVVDESDLFRDYLRGKLERFGLEVETGINGLDAISKIRNSMPDAVIMDYHLSRKSCKEVLEDKARDPNAATIPVILTAQKIDKNRLLELVPFNVKKVFMKPIKMDALYATLSEALGMRFEMDTTPCVIEAHVNDNIVFIEIAKGLNREKIDLLRFKIAELLELYEIKAPRVLVMLSDMDLTFVDGPNLESLLGIVLASSRAKARHVKILTNQGFVREYAKGRPEYADIEVVPNLQNAIEGLVGDYDPDLEKGTDRTALISEKILAASSAGGRKSETVEMRFEQEGRKSWSFESIRDAGKGLSIAVVDDDFVIQELIRTTFSAIDAKVAAFSDGRSYLDGPGLKDFDLLFLDLAMPGVNGFEVLARLRAQDIETPVIILSAISQREAVVKAFQSGVKSYLIKPLKPDQILRKTLEILRANF